jgi:glycosyltransferase involved in cell wall biosynthesis
MNILWVKVGGLWPLNIGGRLRSYHIVAELAKHHRVTVLTTHAPGEDAGALRRQLPQCERVVAFPFAAPKVGSAGFAAALARSWMSSLPVDLWKWRVPELRAEAEWILGTGAVDICVADFLHAIPNLPPRTSVPVILFAHNVEAMIWKRLAANEGRPLRRALLEIESRKMRRSERHACARSRSIVAVSPVDAACLAKDAQAIATGVDTSYFKANGTPERDMHLVFTGAMDWFPNEDAMLFFFAEVLPLIRKEIPGVSVTVVGRNPSAQLAAAAAAASVNVTGTVDDVRPFVDEGAVYVVPLRIGGGTRLKIFEALSMEKAVVSTSIGAEGLPLVDGEHFVRADAPADFSRAVVSLLRDPKRRRLLGHAGRQLVQSRHSWSSVARDFETKCLQALS